MTPPCFLVTCKSCLMKMAQVVGHQHRKFGADHVCLCVAKNFFCRIVDQHNATLFIDGDDRVGRRSGKRVKSVFTLAQRFLGPLALDQLTKMATNGGHNSRLIGIGNALLATKEFHHSNYLTLQQNWKAEAATQSFMGRHSEPWEICILREFCYPVRLAACQNATW